MLIITRRQLESVIINGNIRVTYLGTNRSACKLGIEAPVDITIHREEIQERIDRNIPMKSKR